LPCDKNAPAPKAVEVRKVLFQGEQDFVDCSIFNKFDMKPGCSVSGPAILEQMDTTIVIPSQWTAYMDGYLNLRIEHEGGVQ